MGYLQGFLVTLKQIHLFGGQRVTTEYPVAWSEMDAG